MSIDACLVSDIIQVSGQPMDCIQSASTLEPGSACAPGEKAQKEIWCTKEKASKGAGEETSGYCLLK